MHQSEYAAAFDAADDVLFPPLGRTNLAPAEALDLDLLVAALRERGRRAARFDGVDAIVSELAGTAREGDVVALLSNGAFGGIHAKLLSKLGG
jgi:UDP-N-acetylmuramate: L-alanyl-gamma-D-glutamyl-meso-diaminopimelate ligase